MAARVPQSLSATRDLPSVVSFPTSRATRVPPLFAMSKNTAWPIGSQLCRRCLNTQAGSVRRTAASRGRIDYKYKAKVANAEEQWQAKAQRTADGEDYNLWDVFEERGFVKDLAGRKDEIRELMRRKRIGAYVGVDPTAPSLHVGHLLPMMPLFWMYFHGYRAVSLLGGATGKIGDPSGRLKDRERMHSSTATTNTLKLHYQLKKVWTNADAKARQYGYKKDWAWKRALVNNAAWWNKLPLMEILRRLGSGIRIGPMLSRDNVKKKLTEGDGMSFAEFTYPLMQAWDWWHMFKSLDVQMQIGGSDQYGNIVTGIDAIKAIRDTEPNLNEKMGEGLLHDPVGFTVPLLTDSSGAKFGKSAGNAVWLDPYMTSVFDLYGYFVRRPDADVERLLKLFTFLPLPEISKIMEEQNADPSKRVAQHKLAQEVVSLIHGDQATRLAEQEHRAMYSKGQMTIPMAQTAGAEQENQYEAEPGKPITLNNAPRVDMTLPESLVLEGKSIAKILYAAGLADSVSDGNRLARQKAAYVGGSPGQPAHLNKGMTPGLLQFTPVHVWFPEDTKNFLIDGKFLILRKGKHNIRCVEMVSDEEWKASGKSYPGEPGKGKVRQLRQQLDDLKASLKEGMEDEVDDSVLVEDTTAADEGQADDESDPVLIFPDESPARVKNLKNQISDLKDHRRQQQSGGKSN